MDTVMKKDHVVKNSENFFRLKDPVSALTHFAGFILAIAALPCLIIKASGQSSGIRTLAGFAVFGLTAVLLYGASAGYHSFRFENENVNRLFKTIDHIAVFYLIAGSYTPVCISVLKGGAGTRLLAAVWAAALAGTVFKLFWVYCPKWLSSLIYIGMGWSLLPVLPELTRLLKGAAFGWLLAGGIFYTLGGVIYALRLKIFHNARFGNHELFHCFVLAGSLCHYIMMFRYIVLFG